MSGLESGVLPDDRFQTTSALTGGGVPGLFMAYGVRCDCSPGRVFVSG